MKARHLIESSDYDADTLKVMFRAFDETWAEICHHFSDCEHQEARLRLAHAMLVVSRDGETEVARLKDDALKVLSLPYRWRGPFGTRGDLDPSSSEKP
jgi:hypothetical protein